MTPVGIPGVVLFLGLQLFAFGIDNDSRGIRLAGLCTLSLGWVLNILAVLLPYITNG